MGDITAVKVTAKVLDGENFQAVVDQLRRLASEPGRNKLYLDFRNVQVLGGGGLGQLVALNNTLRSVGGRLTIFNIAPNVYEVFEATRTTGVLDVHPRSPT
jgi:anti-anti-sigma factor